MKQTTAILRLIACLLCFAGCGRTDDIPGDPMESPAAQTDGEPAVETPAKTEPESTPTEPEPIFESEPEPKMGFPPASQDPVTPHYPESFAAAEYDFDDVRCVSVASGVTNNTIFLKGQVGRDAILASIQPLTGENPVSSYGFYGGHYRITLYETYLGIPTEEDVPILDIWILDESHVILYDTVYETAGNFSYSAMYTMDPEVGRAIIAACGEFIE